MIVTDSRIYQRASNPEIKEFMKINGWGENWGLLEQYYMERLRNVTLNLSDRKMDYIVWQESMTYCTLSVDLHRNNLFVFYRFQLLTTMPL